MLEQEKEHGGGILADEMGMGKVRLAGSLYNIQCTSSETSTLRHVKVHTET